MIDKKFFRMSRHDTIDQNSGYFSCQELEGAITFIHGGLTMCGHVHSGNKGMPYICEYHGGEVPLEKIHEARKTLKEKNQTNEDTPCKGCEFLEKREWEQRDKLVNHITIGHYTPCNLRCTYCYTTKYSEEQFKIMNTPPYNAAKAVQSIADQNALCDGTTAWLTGGEPTMFVDFEDIISVLDKYSIYPTIGTNCVKPVSEKVLQGVSKGNIEILCSVDAGTKEKYKEVKGRNQIDNVWSNLKIYTDANPNCIIVKYIYMDNNYQLEEVNSFILGCIQSGIKKISISRDVLAYEGTLSENRSKLPEHINESIVHMIYQAVINNIDVYFDVNWPVFKNHELEKLQGMFFHYIEKQGYCLNDFMKNPNHGKIASFVI